MTTREQRQQAECGARADRYSRASPLDTVEGSRRKENMTSAPPKDQSVCIHVTAQRKADEIEAALVRNGLNVHTTVQRSRPLPCSRTKTSSR